MRYLVYFLCTISFLASSCENRHNDHRSLIINQNTASDTITIEEVALLKRIASIRNEVIRVGRLEMEQLSLANQKKTIGITRELLVGFKT